MTKRNEKSVHISMCRCKYNSPLLLKTNHLIGHKINTKIRTIETVE